MNTINQEKSVLRLKYKELRKSIPKDKKSELDLAVTKRFLNLTEYKNADTLYAFISKDIEVNTKAIIDDALKSGKKVAVPVTNPDDVSMEFYYINSYSDLIDGSYGIKEPDISKCVKAGEYESSIMAVPGLVFDKKGFRIGFGKGYYDRFISRYKGVTAGICYSGFIKAELPFDKYDKAVTLIVTDKYTIDTRQGENYGLR